jgi:alkylation response protein AidB-like acyl-CoA dehydrogenase
LKVSLSEDQRAVEELFSEFFAKTSEPMVVRRAEPLGFDAELWSKLCALDAPAMGVAVEKGGGGATLADLVVLAECVGRSLAPVPVIEHTVAVRALPQPSAEQLAGEEVATIALQSATGGLDWGLIPAGAVARTVIGSCNDETIAVSAQPPGVAPANHACMPVAFRSFEHDNATTLGDTSVWSRALSEWQLLTAASLVGIAARSLDIGVDYVKSREQFGRSIGSFQALQHGLADLPGLIDGARLLTFKAAWITEMTDRTAPMATDVDDNEVNDPTALALMAYVFATEVAAQVTDRVLHYHGGYGFAEEYDIGLYYRRARGWPLVLGDPAAQYERLADRLFGAPSTDDMPRKH